MLGIGRKGQISGRHYGAREAGTELGQMSVQRVPGYHGDCVYRDISFVQRVQNWVYFRAWCFWKSPNRCWRLALDHQCFHLLKYYNGLGQLLLVSEKQHIHTPQKQQQKTPPLPANNEPFILSACKWNIHLPRPLIFSSDRAGEKSEGCGDSQGT